MGKGRDKVMKTYGRHKNRVIKADFWDAEFNSSIKNIFSDDSDFVDTKLSKNGCKRKKNEDKENKKTKRGKCTQGRKEEADHKLFSEKETTSSFFDFCEGGPLKDLPPKTVPASVRRNHVCNNAKLYFEASQLQIESKEQNTSISFSDFDNYNLCISDSPAGTTTKTECPTLNDSGRLGKGLSPEVFSQITKPFQSTESDKNLESLHQNDTIFRKPQNTGITTSTPLAPITAVSRLQNSRIPDDHSLFEQTQDSQSSISHLMDHDDSVRYSTPMKMNSSQPPKDSLSPAKNNSTDSADLYDCFVHLKKLDQEIENPLNMSDHLGQFVSFRSKEQKTSSRGQLSTDNNNNNNNNSDDEDATENKGSKGCLELFRSIAICANCSFDQPCGDRCAYMDIKLSPDTCSVQLQKLEDIFDNLHKTESPKDLDLDTVDFDAPMNLFESYFHTSHLCHSLEDSNHEDEDMGKVADVVEDRKELDVEKLNQLMSSTLLSVVEEENEEELVGSSSGDEETDEENEEELVGSSSRDEETDEEELVGSSSRDEETDEEELVGSSSRDEETDEEELVGSSSRDEETDEEELVGSSSSDRWIDKTDEELVGSSSRDEEELVGSSSRYELVGSSSRVEETDEEELVGSSSRYELVGSSSRVEETDEEELVGSSSRYELVGSSSRVEETDEEELVGSSSRDEETDEELVGSSSRDEETDEEELVGSSSSDEETDEENESGSIHLHVESCGPAECENVKQTRQEVDVRLPLPHEAHTLPDITRAPSVLTRTVYVPMLHRAACFVRAWFTAPI